MPRSYPSPRPRPRRPLVRRFALFLLTLFLLTLPVSLPQSWAALSHLHTYSVSSVPSRPAAMVFGAGLAGSAPSPLLARRLDVALALYKAGKVRAILLSGDTTSGHDEPAAMARYLQARGVPASRLVKDGSGLDTYDSCKRAHDVFHATALILVSQSFHLPRALATCRALGIDALGVPDPTPDPAQRSREFAATEKAFWDAVISHRPATVSTPPSSALALALS